MKKSLNILLIEDDAVEVMKFNRVIQSLNAAHKVIDASSCDQALELLSNNFVLPDIIIMNTQTPKTCALDFLSIIRADKKLKVIPAIILTISDHKREISTYYKYNLCGYMLIPLSYNEYVDRIRTLLDYWCTNEFIMGYSA